jgi:hypothetical protein
MELTSGPQENAFKAASEVSSSVTTDIATSQILIIEEEEEILESDEPTGSTSTLSSLTPVFRWSPSALAFSNTTPWLARILFPTVCLVTHILFFYGQTAPMWKLRLVADIDVWANATDFATKQTFNLIGVKYDNHFVYEEDKNVQTFTYAYAINHLWLAKGIPGKILPRVAAILLIVFSGAWPHIKLLWLHATWFFGKQAAARTTTLQWLSALGKWSLADVLVVCVMVGVLNLDWIVDPAAIKEGIISDLPAILQIIESQYDETGLCNKLLKLHCENAKKAATRAKCKACITAVSEAYTRPDWAQSTGKSLLNGVDTSGGGSATLRVVGMRGIYAFCGAVIVSILLSLLVDIFDNRAKQALRKQQEQERALASGQPNSLQPVSSPVGDNEWSQPLLGNTGRSSPLELDAGLEDNMAPRQRALRRFSPLFLLAVVSTLLFVLAAVDLDTMERRVLGAGPEMLHDILGVNWERSYSLRSLMWTTGAHGGWDFMLMGTFALFCVLGPLIRSVLLLLVALLDGCRIPVHPVADLVNFIGAFCSWEVFAIAIMMVQMLMPSITNTIIRNKVCQKISDDGSCLQVEFNVLPWTFWTVALGGLLLVASSCTAVSRGTDRSPLDYSSSTRTRSQSGAVLSNHDYERLQNGGQGTRQYLDEGLDQLVFETNDV